MQTLIQVFRADLRRQPRSLLSDLVPKYALATTVYAVGLGYVLVLWNDFVEVESLLHRITFDQAETLLRQKLQLGAVFLCVFYSPLLLRRFFFTAFVASACASFLSQIHDLSEYFALSFSTNQVERFQQQFIFFNFNLLSLVRLLLLGLLIWASVQIWVKLRRTAS